MLLHLRKFREEYMCIYRRGKWIGERGRKIMNILYFNILWKPINEKKILILEKPFILVTKLKRPPLRKKSLQWQGRSELITKLSFPLKALHREVNNSKRLTVQTLRTKSMKAHKPKKKKKQMGDIHIRSKY